MINSHKELVDEVLNWGSKMDLIKEVIYVTDINNADAQVNNVAHRGFVFSPINMSFGDDYNSSVSYGFTIVDKVADNADAIVNSETENMFCISALYDYINYVDGGGIEFSNLDFTNISSNSGVLTSLSGIFSLEIKRTASFWKKLESFNS